MSREIPLTQGYVAIVDDEDFGELKRYSWYALKRRHGPMARRMMKRDNNGKQRSVYMHRQIMQAPAGMQVDHRNHDTLDNRRANLRICTAHQNLGNMRKRPGLSSRFKGVYWVESRGKWRASISAEKRTKPLGYFEDEVAAARAYNHEAILQFGEFARLNDV